MVGLIQPAEGLRKTLRSPGEKGSLPQDSTIESCLNFQPASHGFQPCPLRDPVGQFLNTQVSLVLSGDSVADPFNRWNVSRCTQVLLGSGDTAGDTAGDGWANALPHEGVGADNEQTLWVRR